MTIRYTMKRTSQVGTVLVPQCVTLWIPETSSAAVTKANLCLSRIHYYQHLSIKIGHYFILLLFLLLIIIIIPCSHIIWAQWYLHIIHLLQHSCCSREWGHNTQRCEIYDVIDHSFPSKSPLFSVYKIHRRKTTMEANNTQGWRSLNAMKQKSMPMTTLSSHSPNTLDGALSSWWGVAALLLTSPCSRSSVCSSFNWSICVDIRLVWSRIHGSFSALCWNQHRHR